MKKLIKYFKDLFKKKEPIDPKMDQKQFEAMSPEQQKRWLEYLSKNKGRIGAI